jgi:hypothetical protein
MDFPFLDSRFTNIQFIVTAVVLVAVLLIAVGVFIERHRTRTPAPGDRLGADYCHAVLKHGSAHQAEAKMPTGKFAWKR